MKRLDMPKLHGRALTGLGLIEWAAGRLDQAVDLLSRAYEVFEQAEDLAEMGRVLTNLGRIRREHHRGRYGGREAQFRLYRAPDQAPRRQLLHHRT